VHDFRIATRRLLSILMLLEGISSKEHLQTANRDLKKRLKSFGRLRDVHTQLLYVGKLRRESTQAQTYYKALEKRECQHSKQMHRELPHCKSRRLADSIGAIKKQLRRLLCEEEKENVFAPALATLRTSYANTLEYYHAIEPADIRTLHRTRVAFKRFRYMIEVLQPMLPEVIQDRLKSMHDYQALMGDIQDLEVLLTSVEKFLKKQDLGGSGWKRFRVKLTQRRAALVHRFLVSADQLCEFDPRKYQTRHNRGRTANSLRL
jgi:CHAD domain-containing protein